MFVTASFGLVVHMRTQETNLVSLVGTAVLQLEQRHSQKLAAFLASDMKGGHTVLEKV